MGSHYRKSKKIGKNLRINFSKSGVGFSIGNKWFRKTFTADGKIRNTYNLPGTGISHTQYESAHTSDVTEEALKTTNRLQNIIIIIILLLFVIIFAGSFISKQQVNIPSPPQHDSLPLRESYSLLEHFEPVLKFYDESTVFVNNNNVALVQVDYDNSYLTNGQILLVSDNPEVASFTIRASDKNHILFAIYGNNTGVANIHAVSIDGKYTSQPIQVIVDYSSNKTESLYYENIYLDSDSDSGVYVLNTATNKIHRPGCSYAPSSSSDNYDLVFNTSGYSFCQHCK